MPPRILDAVRSQSPFVVQEAPADAVPCTHRHPIGTLVWLLLSSLHPTLASLAAGRFVFLWSVPQSAQGMSLSRRGSG